MRAITIIILLVTALNLSGQNRIPFDGENIIFYPFNKNNTISAEGYDCFYDKDLVSKNGKYNFKPKFRLNRNENNTTSPNDIEGYTFKVLNHEILNDNTDEEILLLFLKRNEDNKEIIMRVPWYTDKKSNAITQSFIKYRKKETQYGKFINHIYINLPFANVDSLAKIKNMFQNNSIVYSRTFSNRDKDFETIIKAINNNNTLDSYEIYNFTDLDFIELYTNDIYKQLCAKLTSSTGKTFTIPVTYLSGNNKMYDPNNGSTYYFPIQLLKTREVYIQDEYKRYRCEDIVNKYQGKAIYYGLKECYNYNDDIIRRTNSTEIRRTNDFELYKITEGTYDCLGFDIQKRYEKDYNYPIPFAILKDKDGVCFRIPVVRVPIGPSYFKTYCENFENYFVLTEEADIIKKQRIEDEQQREINKKNRLQSLTKEFGKVYANFLIEKDEETIERFRNLTKKYGKENAKFMIDGNVQIGWSKAMCKEAWGKPDKINTTTGSWGVHEQWVYEYSSEYSYDIFCLYFENGILTTIQE